MQRAQVERERQRIAKPLAGGPSHRTGTDGLPELAQPFDPLGFRRPGDDGGVERADRNTGQPVRPDAGFMQALIDAGLIGSQRSAALQHQGDDIVWQRVGPLCRIDVLACHVQHCQNSLHCG